MSLAVNDGGSLCGGRSQRWHFNVPCTNSRLVKRFLEPAKEQTAVPLEITWNWASFNVKINQTASPDHSFYGDRLLQQPGQRSLHPSSHCLSSCLSTCPPAYLHSNILLCRDNIKGQFNVRTVGSWSGCCHGHWTVVNATNFAKVSINTATSRATRAREHFRK